MRAPILQVLTFPMILHPLKYSFTRRRVSASGLFDFRKEILFKIIIF